MHQIKLSSSQLPKSRVKLSPGHTSLTNNLVRLLQQQRDLRCIIRRYQAYTYRDMASGHTTAHCSY